MWQNVFKLLKSLTSQYTRMSKTIINDGPLYYTELPSSADFSYKLKLIFPDGTEGVLKCYQKCILD